MADSSTMKRITFCLILFLSLASLGFSQQNKIGAAAPLPAIPVLPGTVRLENDRDMLVFYAVVPLRTGEFTSLTNQARVAIDRLQEKQAELEYLAGGAVAPAVRVSDGEQLVLGFSVESGSSTWPVWYLRIPPAAQRTAAPWYSLSTAKPLQDASKQTIVLRSIDFDLPARPIRIDGRFVDWLKFSDNLSLKETAVPLRITQQFEGEKRSIQAGAALSLRKAGTDIENVRLVRDTREVFLMISSRTLMAPGLSYLVRVFATESEAQNQYTIEIPLDGPTGPVLLWKNGKPNPTTIGTYATADHSLEARFTYTQAGLGLEKVFESTFFFELSSLWSKSGLSEEFVWARFSAARGLISQ